MKVSRFPAAASLAIFAIAAGCGGRPDPAFYGGAEWRDPTVEASAPKRSADYSRPKLVVIRAEWCPFCKSAQPAIDRAYAPFRDRVDLVVLDVTDDATTSDSEKRADAEGVAAFFAQYRGRTPTAGVFIAPGEGRRVHGNMQDPATLTAELTYALEQFRARVESARR
jgi:thiol-disulfide isomerase/thioredoxin